MLRVTINEPADVEYVEGTSGHNIVWTPHSVYPVDYLIERDGVPVEDAQWDGGPIGFSVDGLTNGTYVFVITVTDFAGYTAADEVIVTVLEPATSPTTTNGGLPPIDPLLLMIIGAAAAGVIIIVLILIMMKKKKS